MKLAGYGGQLIACMRTYKSKHPTFTNSCQIGSRKLAVHFFSLKTKFLPMED